MGFVWSVFIASWPWARSLHVMFMDSQNTVLWNLMAQDLLNHLTYFVRCKKEKKKFILLENHIFL